MSLEKLTKKQRELVSKFPIIVEAFLDEFFELCGKTGNEEMEELLVDNTKARCEYSMGIPKKLLDEGEEDPGFSISLDVRTQTLHGKYSDEDYFYLNEYLFFTYWFDIDDFFLFHRPDMKLYLDNYDKNNEFQVELKNHMEEIYTKMESFESKFKEILGIK